MLHSPTNFEDYFNTKWIAPELVVSKVETIKQQGKTVVTLNGSFDLLHAGHLQIIYEASRQGDILIVALNTDSSIQKYKSPKRPIVPFVSRARVMAALGVVDFVTSFDETDPRALLEKIRPHVHVNGAEYGAECIEAETVKRHGGTVYIVPLVPGLSTSNLIEKIKQTCD